MRDAWLPLGLVLVGGAGLFACGQPFELTGSTSTGSGLGGAPSTASAGGGGDGSAAASGGGDAATTTSTSTGVAMCIMASECTALPTSLCGEPACQLGKCGLHQLQKDGPSFSQRYGDCQIATCSKDKLTFVENNQDIYDDGNPCTKDTCNNGAPMTMIKVGSACGLNGVCSSKGTCVECVGNGTCPGNKPMCINNYCSAATCQNGGVLPDGNETDVDCGGDECGPCDPGLKCKGEMDCKSGVCKEPFMNALYKQCQIPTCIDGVHNGTETDVDCGGAGCPDSSKCADAKHCAVHGDCQSDVCQGGVCQPASCTDGVKNGNEMGIDCGGGGPGCATKCPPG
jgi:hypothetical protein